MERVNNLERSRQVDSLRGIATLLVVAYHFSLIFTHNKFMGLWGFLGVKIFFIISGFLLLASFEKNKHKYGIKEGTKKYFLSRFWRIVPAYYVNLIFILLITPFFLDPQWIFTSKEFLWQVIQHFSFISYFIVKAVGFGINDVYWTLCIEALWYLIIPLLFIWFNTTKRISILTILSVSYLYLLEKRYLDFFINWIKPDPIYNVPIEKVIEWASYQLPGQFLFFGIGIILWKQKSKLDQININILTSWIFTGLTIVVIYFSSIYTPKSLTLINLYYAILATVVFLLIYISKKAYVPLLAWVGDISYSMYLWNFPLLIIAKKVNVLTYIPLWKFAILYAITLFVISAFSYYFIEKVGMNRKQKEKIEINHDTTLRA